MTSSSGIKPVRLKLNLARLRHKHQQIKDRIAAEMARPAPCALALQQLKRQRLRIKDTMARLAQHGPGHSAARA